MVLHVEELDFKTMRTFALGPAPIWLASEASVALGYEAKHIADNLHRTLSGVLADGRDYRLLLKEELQPWKSAGFVDPHVGRLMLVTRPGLWRMSGYAKNTEIADWLLNVLEPAWMAGMLPAEQIRAGLDIGSDCAEAHAELMSSIRTHDLYMSSNKRRNAKILARANEMIRNNAYKYGRRLMALRVSQGETFDPDELEWNVKPWIVTQEGAK